MRIGARATVHALAIGFVASLFVSPTGPSTAGATPPPTAAWGRLGPGVLGRSARARAIRRFAEAWRGTPYRWGGTARSGIDCSAYLRRMYREVFELELPRTTRQQIGLGLPLSLRPRRLTEGLEPGDVIFYVGPSGVPSHVVVYAGDGHITHSVSGRGVVMEPLGAVAGRRVVARRFLVPARSGQARAGGYGPIPAAGPSQTTEIPCPADLRLRTGEVRMLARTPLADLEPYAERQLCEVRALARVLEARSGPAAEENARRLAALAAWLEHLEDAEGTLFER